MAQILSMHETRGKWTKMVQELLIINIYDLPFAFIVGNNFYPLLMWSVQVLCF